MLFRSGTVVRVYSRRCDKGQETGRLLEFRGGTTARPILSPATGDPVPIDGGTRVEVLLKDDPNGANGLLAINSHNNRTMSLGGLVGALAPNLDVAIAIMTQEGTQPIVQPGDWLKISDLDLVRRLNGSLDKSEEGTPNVDRMLMQPIQEASGKVFGRAFISPARYTFFAARGWVTISGLRAARLYNVEGVLLGAAVTATRDSAQPLVSKDALAQWASNQAELIAASVKDEERQARAAEVVLECGGNIGSLKFIKWGADWLTAGEFKDVLLSVTQFAISFDGDFEYNEDQDDVHPKEFREYFEISENVAVVLNHDGAILKAGKHSWPKSLTGGSRISDSNTASHGKEMIRQVWGANFQENEEECVVGKVGCSEIIRHVTVFSATVGEE